MSELEACARLKTTIFYTSILFGHLFLSCGSFGLNLLLFFAIVRTKFLPNNVRLLLGNMTFALLLTVMVSVIRNTNYVEILINGSLVPMHPVLCSVSTVYNTILAVVVITSMGSLGYERWIATKNLEQNNTQKNLKTKILLGCIWVLALVSAIISVNGQILGGEPDTEETFHNHSNVNITFPEQCTCPKRTPSSQTSLIVITIPYLVCEILLVFIYVNIWRVNKLNLSKFDLNTNTHSLQERYEIRQNIRTTIMMLPTVLAHGICWLVLMVSLFLHLLLKKSETNPVETSVIDSLIRMPFELYGLLHPVLIFSASKHLRSAAMCCKSPAAVANQSHTTEGQPAAGSSKARSFTPGKSRAVEFRVNPKTGLKIVESIWEKNKQKAGPSKKVETDEQLVEIDQLWEDGRPKWHRRPQKTGTEEKRTVWTSFVSKFHDSDSSGESRGKKYKVNPGLPQVE